MKKAIVVALFAFLAAHAAAAQAGMNINVGLYTAPPAVVAPPPVVVYDAPPPRPVPNPAPRFVYSPALGYYVSYEPYDMAYIDRCYYQYRGGGWYMASSYAGPWVVARGRAIPPQLRGTSYGDFRYYRDRECHRGERYARWEGRGHDRWEHRHDRW